MENKKDSLIEELDNQTSGVEAEITPAAEVKDPILKAISQDIESYTKKVNKEFKKFPTSKTKK